MNLLCVVPASRHVLLLLSIAFLLMYVIPALIYVQREGKVRYMFQFNDLVRSGERLAKFAQAGSYLFVVNAIILVLVILRPLYCGR